MTIWTHSVSWSKAILALKCELELQYTIDKRPFRRTGTNYYQNLGKVVQFIFEQYFNQKVNTTAAGRTDAVMMRVTEKILLSGHIRGMATEFEREGTRTEDNFKNSVRQQVLNGFRSMALIGVLDKPLKSEHKWSAVFRGHRIFGMIDFTWLRGQDGNLFDGKGHQEKNADPRQVMYYGLGMASSGIFLKQPTGFLYWQHDPVFEEIDVSPAALKRFADEEMVIIKDVFDRLKVGIVGEMPANPSKETCKYCNWKLSCKHSAYYIPAPEGPIKDGLVSFD